MLKKIGGYNDFPKDFKQPKLKKGETALYRLLNSVPDPNKPGTERFPSRVKIRTVDRVRINEEGDICDIGLVTELEINGAIKNVKYFVVPAQEDAGYFRCVQGDIASEELYSFFEMCNYNGSNPLRDPAIEAKFYRIDEERDAVEMRQKRTVKLASMNYAMNLNLAQVKEYAASRAWDENDKEDVLRGKIETFAEKEPEAFMKSVQDKDLIVKATIKRAVDKGVIRFEVAQSKWIWVKGGETIAIVAKSEGTEPIVGLCDFIKSNKKGDAVYQEIAKQLK